FTALDDASALPVSPESPESPEWAWPLETAVALELPVSPLLVALDWAVAQPVSPDVAVGLAVTDAPAPAPPWAEPVATELPPRAKALMVAPVPPVMTLTAEPPGPATGMATPPEPPTPPAAKRTSLLSAPPVSPDSDD